jgi:hypothetical protein
MSKRLVYFSLSLAVSLAALVTQFSLPRAVAKQPPPTEECLACEASCDVVHQACTAERGTRGPGFGQCQRELQQCRQVCNGRGGACHPQSAPADEAPAPTPTPVPTPD